MHIAGASACASKGASPHPNLVSIWRHFLELPVERALAIAGDPRRVRWVTAAASGYLTLDEASAEALAQCRIRREIQRMRAECVLYAVGEEIVWRGR